MTTPSPPTETTAGALGGIFCALLMWVLNTYVFAGQTPAPVTAAVYALPAVLGILLGFFVRKSAKHESPPAAPAPPPPATPETVQP